MSERCRECANPIFVRTRHGKTFNRARIVSRYPPDGSLRPGEQILCGTCGTPHAVRYDVGSLRYRLKQDGPPRFRRARL